MKEINGTEIHPIGIGTWTMGESSGDARKAEIEAIKYSISLGQNHIDTAEMYASGRAEQVVGDAIRGLDRDKLFIASKLWKDHTTEQSVVPAVEAMLERIDTDYLDMLYVHSSWPEVDMESLFAGMGMAVDMGLTKSIAVSNYNLDQLKQAQEICKHPIVAVQNLYNVFDREDVPDDLLSYCQEQGIAMVAYQPIKRGAVSHNQTLQDIAKSHDATPTQVALAWLLAQSSVHTIPKSSSKEHIDDNLKAMDLKLSATEMQQLAAIGKA